MLRKKRFMKLSAIVLGGVMGWVAAGAVADDSHTKHAEVDGHKSSATDAGSHGEKGAGDHGDSHGGHHKPDMSTSVPTQDQPWYPMVLMAIGGLFVAAIVVGVGAKKMGKDEPGKIASDHDAAHAHH